MNEWYIIVKQLSRLMTLCYRIHASEIHVHRTRRASLIFLSQFLYSLGRHGVKNILWNVFLCVPLSCLDSMAAAVLAQWPVEHLWNIQPNIFYNLTPQTVVMHIAYASPLSFSSPLRAMTVPCAPTAMHNPSLSLGHFQLFFTSGISPESYD